VIANKSQHENSMNLMRIVEKSSGLARGLLFVLTAAAMAGCVSTSQKSVAQVDAWLFNRDWINSAAFANTTLKGKTGQAYPVRGSDLTNLKMVVVAIKEQSRLDPQVALTAGSTPNAFAFTNNGRQTIGLTLSMLNEIGSDKDALATTLGHELAHLYLKHGETRQQRAESAKGVSNVLGAVLGFAGVPMGGTLASLGVGIVTTAYSREEERDADILGLRWAMAAGYSACGSARTMKMLKAMSSTSSLPFLSSHPGHDERIERSNQAALVATGKGC
jgi:Zn-dependent protease with chaperone function